MPRNIFSVCDEELNYVEILRHILDPVPFSVLVNLASASGPLRRLVQDLIRERTDYFARLFVPRYMVVDFFDLLSYTNSSIAGGLVRCIVSNNMYGHFKVVDPSQLNIILPYMGPDCEAQDQRLRGWLRFLYTCGYRPTIPEHEATAELRASCSRWIFLTTGDDSYRVVSLIETKTCSVFPPIFQAAQTSNFFAMSSTRIYSMYPGLHDLSINLSLRPQNHRGIMDNFNFGLLSMRDTENWEAYDGECKEACPAVHRRTKGYPGWRIFRWGGIEGKLDTGDVVSKPDPYDGRNIIWKLPGDCSNQRCPNFSLSVDLLEESV